MEESKQNEKKMDELALLGIRKRILFPGVLLRLTIGRPKSVKLVQSFWDSKNRTFKKNSLIFICAIPNEDNSTVPKEKSASVQGTKEETTEKTVLRELTTVKVPDAEAETVYTVGTVARILQLSRVNDTENKTYQFSMLVEGVQRGQFVDFVSIDPFCIAKVAYISDELPSSPSSTAEFKALSLNIRQLTTDLLNSAKSTPSVNSNVKTQELIERFEKSESTRLVDMLISILDMSIDEKQQILVEHNVNERLKLALELINRQLEVIKISEKIQHQIEDKLKSSQREYYLRQQLKAINNELNQINKNSGEGGDEVDEIEQLAQQLKAIDFIPEIRKVIDRDMNRLKSMQPAQPEYTVLRSYLETVVDLPWNISTQDTLDVRNAQNQLDKDHYGLDKVKKRIVEFLAVRSLQQRRYEILMQNKKRQAIAEEKQRQPITDSEAVPAATTKSLEKLQKSDSVDEASGEKELFQGPILCLVGPPGVGKTSLGRSIAKSLNRKFARVSLGGVRDEAEIRGHRRTYIGAMPGTIINSLKKCGANNPVMLLDEIDKITTDSRQGDPSSALLEVLDPEQNSTFTDHYLNIPFDLSKVLFIATANNLSTIPIPLLDRMEIIEIPSYTLEEKVKIGEKYLIPKQMIRNGIYDLHDGNNLVTVKFLRSGIEKIISGYTRESGVRGFEREIASICRYVAVKVAESHNRTIAEGASDAANTVSDVDSVQTTASNLSTKVVPDVQKQEFENIEDKAELSFQLDEMFRSVIVDGEVVEEILGPVRYESEVARRVSLPGVSTGLAWTSVGGDILFIETSIHYGTGKLQLTGQLGSVMQESAQTALSFIRAHQSQLNLSQMLRQNGVRTKEELNKIWRSMDMHVHFPAGATKKDGPSAGVAVVASIVSALSGRCVRNDTAVTGEITLRGQVLPVGGIKEKVIAAHRAGLKRVVLPDRNKKDALDIPQEVRNDLDIIYVKYILEAMVYLFQPYNTSNANISVSDTEVFSVNALSTAETIVPDWLLSFPISAKNKSRFSIAHQTGNNEGEFKLIENGKEDEDDDENPQNPSFRKKGRVSFEMMDVAGPVFGSML